VKAVNKQQTRQTGCQLSDYHTDTKQQMPYSVPESLDSRTMALNTGCTSSIVMSDCRKMFTTFCIAVCLQATHY